MDRIGIAVVMKAMLGREFSKQLDGHCSRVFCLLFTLCCVSGCAIDRIREGTEATDFSGIYAGMPRSEFESLVGKVVEQSEAGECHQVVYEYDRGYSGCVASGRCEEISGGVMAWGRASEVFGTIATAGTLQWMTWYEVHECQTGYLRASYTPTGNLNSIRLLDPDQYKTGTYLWDRDLRKPWLNNPCREIYDHPRPLQIPPELLENPPSDDSK